MMSVELIKGFYSSFSAGDGEAMASCYADGAVFEDPVFGVLSSTDVRDMWRMLCENATDLKIDFTVEEANETSARVRWIAHYTFSATGRLVRNDVMATIQIVDGKITDHRDQFSFWKWSSQALGVPGRLLGWSPPLRAKVRKMALGNLAKYQSS